MISPHAQPEAPAARPKDGTTSADPRTYDYSRPTKTCDVVMKGGITSGVVYPHALCELARTYRFVNVGGTSAGAIAAAAAAAAEHGRDAGGFAKLADASGVGRRRRQSVPALPAPAGHPPLLPALHRGARANRARQVAAPRRRGTRRLPARRARRARPGARARRRRGTDRLGPPARLRDHRRPRPRPRRAASWRCSSASGPVSPAPSAGTTSGSALGSRRAARHRR